MKLIDPSPAHANTPQYLQATANQIIRCTTERKYCALLGPRFSGKTTLLNFVKEEFKQKSKACITINLYETETARQLVFFTSLARIIAKCLEDEIGIAIPLSPEGVTDSAAFRSFIKDGLDILKADLVLILDHLEGAPSDLIRALLVSLRAVYMEQREGEHQLVVIVAGALSLASLATGETSPFRGIVRRVMVELPPDDESKALVEEFFSKADIQVSFSALKYLIHAARGDRILITKLCERIAQLVSKKPSKRLSIPLLETAMQEFIAKDALSHAPLQEALRLIETDPDLLVCTLLLVNRGTVQKKQLPLPLFPDADPFYLTGVIRKVQPDGYEFRNEIYRQFLTKHFNPGRVGHLLTMAGRWSQAIEYLETSIGKGDLQYRSDLLSATIHSMYASPNIGKAIEYLTRGLCTGFGIEKCRVWYGPSGRSMLKLIGGLGKYKPAIGLEIPIYDERLEARAYRDVCTLRGHEKNGGVEWAIPLSISERHPIGVVYAVICMVDWESAKQREWELELKGFLCQAARAIQEVESRLKWQNQLEALDQIALDIAGRLQIKQILRTAVEKSVELIGGTGGGVYLLDDASGTFTLEAQYGLSQSLDGVKFDKDLGEIGEIHRTRQPVSISGYYHWAHRQKSLDEYGLTAVVGAPILLGDRLLGVIAIHDHREGRAFQKIDEELLLRVGNHIAVALENARLYQRWIQEKEKILAVEKLSVMSQVAGEFVHRMNNLAGTIPVRVDIAKADLNPDDQHDSRVIKQLDKIYADSQQLLQAAQQIRESTEHKAPALVEINELVDIAIKIAFSFLPGIESRVTLSVKKVPYLSETLVERNELLDTLIDIIKNGLDAMTDGGALTVETRLGILAGLSCIEVAVTDTGQGIPLENLSRIFDLFFTTKPGGLGFGLWKDKAFLQRIGGDIEVQSDVGKGTTFIIKIPIIDIGESS